VKKVWTVVPTLKVLNFAYQVLIVMLVSELKVLVNLVMQTTIVHYQELQLPPIHHSRVFPVTIVHKDLNSVIKLHVKQTTIAMDPEITLHYAMTRPTLQHTRILRILHAYPVQLVNTVKPELTTQTESLPALTNIIVILQTQLKKLSARRVFIVLKIQLLQLHVYQVFILIVVTQVHPVLHVQLEACVLVHLLNPETV